MGQKEDPGLAPFYMEEYKAILSESNRFVASVFTPQYVEQQPWTDLLSEEHRERWQHYDLQSYGMASGVLQFLGPPGKSETNGLVAFPDVGGFRDFDLEMEFSLRGTVDVLFRLGRRVDDSVEYQYLSTSGMEPLLRDRTYTLRALFVADTLSCQLTPEDSFLPVRVSDWSKSPKGAIGFQVHEEAEVRVTRLRVRLLRGSIGP